jgi:hypothetical protein
MQWHDMQEVTLAVVLAAWFSPAVQQPPAQQGDEWVRRAPKLGVQRLIVPGRRVTLEYPKRDWLLLPSGGSMLVNLAEKNGNALVQLERTALKQALAPEEITDLFAELEAQTVHDRYPEATSFVSRLADVGRRRIVMLQYDRPGTRGAERVRQYSLPVGLSLYRLVCAAPAAQFARFEQVFAHIAASLTIEGTE